MPNMTLDARDASALVDCPSAGFVHAVTADSVLSLLCVSSKRFNIASASRVTGSPATSTPAFTNPTLGPTGIVDLPRAPPAANGSFAVFFNPLNAANASAFVNPSPPDSPPPAFARGTTTTPAPVAR
jgi:hypothetical protein